MSIWVIECRVGGTEEWAQTECALRPLTPAEIGPCEQERT